MNKSAYVFFNLVYNFSKVYLYAYYRLNFLCKGHHTMNLEFSS